jgi:glycolate oxidase subunit GlcD
MPTSSTATDEALAGLAGRLTGRLVLDPDVVTAYSKDHCLPAPAGTARALVRAETVADVQEVLRFATGTRTPVVTRGAGTGLTGGSNALDGCIVLALDRMNAILELDPVARVARVQAGVINADLDRAAREHGLFYAPDPGSKAISSIGGNIATNAGGMCCAKYGVTRDHVLEIDAVLPDGSLIQVGARTRKDVAGLSLKDLLIGSEGTLAVVVDATVRLLPAQEQHATTVMTFADLETAMATVAQITSRMTPVLLELMDRTTVQAVNRHVRADLDESAAGLLLARFEGAHGPEQAKECAALAEAGGATEVYLADSPEDGEAMLEVRRQAIPALESLGTILLDDVCVPVHQLPAMVAAVEESAARHGLVVGTFGHAADGNLHPTIVFDPASPESVQAARTCFDELVESALALGGTVSGEHGVGQIKRGLLPLQYGEAERALMARVKQAFDPLSILNPGRGF